MESENENEVQKDEKEESENETIKEEEEKNEVKIFPLEENSKLEEMNIYDNIGEKDKGTLNNFVNIYLKKLQI